MAVKNLYRESILQAKKMKEATAHTTRDNLMKSLRQSFDQDVFEDELDDEIVEEEEPLMDGDDDFDIDSEIDDELGLEESDDFDIDSQLDDELGLEQDNDLDVNVIDDLEAEEGADDGMFEDDVYDSQLDDIIAELDGELEDDDDVAYTETALQQNGEIEVQPGDAVSTPGTDLDDIGGDDQLMQRIMSVLQSEDEDETPAKDEDEQDDEMLEQVRRLRKENKMYKKNLLKIKSEISQTKNVSLKGRYALKLFEKFNLNKKQKMKVIENFDRARNERQIKLIYATLSENLKARTLKQNKSKSRKINKKLVSRKIKSTRSKLSEDKTNDGVDTYVKNLFKTRAGI